MYMKRKTMASFTLVAGAVLACVTASVAQQPAAIAEAARYGVTFTDPDFEKFAGLFSGSWKSSKPVQAGEASVDVVLSAAPVKVQGLSDTLYVEMARPEAMDVPYRQVILQLHRSAGQMRMRTLEFRRPSGEVIALRGLWAAPQTFPNEISSNDLIATMDMQISAEGSGFKGVTVRPFATTAGGAVEMTSDMSIAAGSLKVADRGMDAAGNIVWGPSAGESVAFERASTGVTVKSPVEGVTVIDFPSTINSARVPQNNDIVKVNYIGSLGDGRVFDNSYERNSPFQYAFDQQIFPGWNTGMNDVRVGQKRKIIISGPMGFGVKGNPSVRVPGNATLYFDVQVVDIMPQVPAPQPIPMPTMEEEKKMEKKE
jgi:hypothetical protein